MLVLIACVFTNFRCARQTNRHLVCHCQCVISPIDRCQRQQTAALNFVVEFRRTNELLSPKLDSVNLNRIRDFIKKLLRKCSAFAIGPRRHFPKNNLKMRIDHRPRFSMKLIFNEKIYTKRKKLFKKQFSGRIYVD